VKRGSYFGRDAYYGYCPLHHYQLVIIYQSESIEFIFKKIYLFDFQEKEDNLKDISAIKPLPAETEKFDPALEMSSCSVATNSEHLSGDVTSNRSKKKKRKKRGRKSIRSVSYSYFFFYCNRLLL